MRQFSTSAKTFVKVFILLSILFAFCKAETIKESVPQIKIELTDCVITAAADGTLSMRSAQRLGVFLEKATGKKPLIEEKNTLGEIKAKCAIIIGTADSFNDIDRFNLSAELGKIKHDGFLLKTVANDGIEYVFALGKTEKGASNAVWRLIRELQVSGKTVFATDLNINESPFFRQREVIVSEPWISTMGIITPEHKKKYVLMNWDEQQIRKYTDLMDSLGFNSIQLSDCWPSLRTLEGTTREQKRDKLILMADQAHKNGQTVSLFVYASSVKDFETGKEYTNHWKGDYTNKACFNEPFTKAVLMKEYNYQANSYGPFVDRIITHWADWGGCRDCNKCTINTALLQQYLLTEMFRAKNPNVESSFSLWFIDQHNNWPGYKDIYSILDAGILLRDTMTLATPTLPRWNKDGTSVSINLEDCRKIHEKGFRADVWGWYLVDFENEPGMYIQTNYLDNYFHAIPDDFNIIVDNHSADDCHHKINLAELYVAAQLLWNPQRPASDALREFDAAMFGDENADKVLSIQLAMEEARRGCIGVKHVALSIQSLPELSLTNQRLRDIRGVKATLAAAKLRNDLTPVFPDVISPQEFLKEIEMQLIAIEERLNFEATAVTVKEMIDNKADKQAVTEAIEQLPAVSVPLEYLTFADYGTYKMRLSALRDAAGLLVSDKSEETTVEAEVPNFKK